MDSITLEESNILKIETDVEILNKHVIECKNVIEILKIVCLKLSGRNAQVINDNENNSIEVRNCERDLRKNNDVQTNDNYGDTIANQIKDEVFQFMQSENYDSVHNSMSDCRHAEQSDRNSFEMQFESKRFLQELKTVLVDKRKEWKKREQIALSHDNDNNHDSNDSVSGDENLRYFLLFFPLSILIRFFFKTCVDYF